MRRALIISTLVAGLAAALALVATRANAHAQGGKTITVVIKRSDYLSVRFVDAPPKSPTGNPDHISPGDLILQTVALRNQSGKRVGTRYDELSFVTPSVNAGSVDLVRSVYVFGDGRIFAAGLHGPKLSRADAVTGGTGAYAGARGTLSDVSARNSNVEKLAIRLMP